MDSLLQCRSTIAFSLRQRMLNFVQNYQYYMTFEVLEPNWCMMEQKLREAITIDVVLQEHNDFLDRCLKDCMLTNSEVLRIVSRILTLCLTFSTILLHHAMPPSSRESSAGLRCVFECSYTCIHFKESRGLYIMFVNISMSHIVLNTYIYVHP